MPDWVYYFYLYFLPEKFVILIGQARQQTEVVKGTFGWQLPRQGIAVELQVARLAGRSQYFLQKIFNQPTLIVDDLSWMAMV